MEKMLKIKKAILTLLFIATIAKTRELEFYSNFKSDKIVYGQEALMADFVSLKSDPKSDLPDSFTVCSSILLQYFTTHQNFIEIYKEDGTHWFNLGLDLMRDMSTFTETIVLYYQTGNTGTIA